jgi:hypothetical protein
LGHNDAPHFVHRGEGEVDFGQLRLDVGRVENGPQVAPATLSPAPLFQDFLYLHQARLPIQRFAEEEFCVGRACNDHCLLDVLVEQVPDSLDALKDLDIGVSVFGQFKLNRFPLVVHFVQLRLELTFLGGDGADFDDLVYDVHDANVFELLQTLGQRCLNHDAVVLLDDVEVRNLEVRVLQRAQDWHERLELLVVVPKLLADLGGVWVLLELLNFEEL